MIAFNSLINKVINRFKWYFDFMLLGISQVPAETTGT